MYIIGVRNLVVEVNAKYIKGMINNPNIQPNATINRWIAGILLFNFQFRHVSAKDHTLADGLSQRLETVGDPEEINDAEEWIDHAYAFSMERINDPINLGPAICDRSESKGSYQTRTDSELNDQSPSTISQSEKTAPAGLRIPRTENAVKGDNRLKAVKGFLDSPQTKLPSSEHDLKRLVKYALEFFILENRLWQKDSHGKHKLVIPEEKWLELIRQAHDELGHKGLFTVRLRLGERFWWPHMDEDIKWYIHTCHECQIRKTKKIVIPPIVAVPRGLFRKVYIDTMLMPKARGYQYIIHARCSLTSYPEWTMVKSENFKMIAKFIHVKTWNVRAAECGSELRGCGVDFAELRTRPQLIGCALT